jgi:ribosomal-protein-alanine N-acetyltransferase
MKPADRIRELLTTAEQLARFPLLSGQDIDGYLGKLQTSAELFTWGRLGQIDGFVAYYCNDERRTSAFITMVVVDPMFQGLGIGQSLVRAVIATARSRSLKSCRLRVHKDNHAANRLYEELGFCAVSTDGDYREMELFL